MSSEYSLDGVDLDQPGRWRVMAGTTMPTVPAPRLTSTEVPFRDGVIDGVGYRVGTSLVTIAFMVEGDSRAALEVNWVALQARLRRTSRLSTLQYQPKGYGPRVAVVRLKSISDPVYTHRELLVETTAVFEVVHGVWEDKDWTVQPLSDMSALSGGCAPMRNMTVMLLPTASSMRIIDDESKTSLTWTGVLNGGQRVLVDVGSYSAVKQSDAGWDVTSQAVDISNEISMSHRGFQLAPDPEGKVSVTVTGGSGYVRAKKAY